MKNRRYVVHADMDAFFASIEMRDNPAFRSRPVVVGADPKNGRGRGVVSTCSYEAREYGIRSAMPISLAYRKCPHAIFLPVDIGKYEKESGRIFDMFYAFTPDIEPVGIDEAFLDISGSYHLFGTPRETCVLIKSKIKNETGLTVSIGLAPTKMAAKIASDLEKPDGIVEVTQESLIDFLRPLEVNKIWGLGIKSEAVLKKMGIKTIGELADTDPGVLTRTFGMNGEHFWQLANGIDDRPVQGESEPKSIGNEMTFEEDVSGRERIECALIALCEKVSSRMRRESMKGRTVTLKVRLQDFDTYTRSVTLDCATNFSDLLYKTIKELYNAFDTRKKRVRLVGVKMSNLMPVRERESLFLETGTGKKEAIHKALDTIKGKFGDASIYRAGGKEFQ